MEAVPLRLLPLDLHAEDLPTVAWLGAALGRLLGVPTLQMQPVGGSPHPERPGVVASGTLVDRILDILENLKPDARPSWILALTGRDLHSPDRTFVFGEATLGGPAAVLSLYRLRPPDGDRGDEILRERLLKEALHEVGHMAGLGHCPDLRCAMSTASIPEEVDRKDPDLCPSCRHALPPLDRP